MPQKIDFKALAEAALDHAEQLLAEWLPQGRRDGHEWKSVNPTRADNSAGSFSINMDTGAWGDFATDDKGGDLVSLCAYLFHAGDQVAAAYDVAERVGFALPPRRGQNAIKPAKKPVNETRIETPPPPGKVAKRSPWVPILPVPEDAPPAPVAHAVRGRPERTWRYLDADGNTLGVVWRFTTSDGGKEVLPQTFCRNETTGKTEWRGLSFPEPRPLYGLDRLAARPESTVIVTEGEKCADVAHAQLGELVSVSWPGGGKAVDKVDWSPLAGRKVVLWADCDAQRDKKTGEILPETKQPGWKTMQRLAELLHALDCRVWIVRTPAPGEKLSGWDIADAVEEGLAGETLAAWMRERLQAWAPPAEEAPPPTSPRGADAGAGGGGPPPADDWQNSLLYGKQGLRECVANVHDILLHEEIWRGVVAFDTFAQRTVKRQPPPYVNGAVGPWDDNDDTQATMWLTRHWGFAPDPNVVGKAIEALAKEHSFNPVQDYLRGLPTWDGINRTDYWLIDYCGVRDTPYVRKVSRYFLIGMVARVMRPGSKFDYCLVLEGEQGKRKSMICRVLGGDWYGDTDLVLDNKDAMAALQGKWVYEFAEMGSVTRAEATKQKSFLSRQSDEFRPPYGKRLLHLLRQCVFIGTTNEDEWNKDPTGGRRFWPVRCEDELSPEGLADIRDQLFAEALQLFEQGERYWPTPEEQRTLFNPEQGQREIQESLVDAIHDWVFQQVSAFSIADAAMTGLKLDASKLTRDLTTRLGTALKKLGCTKIEKRNGMTRYWYMPPKQDGTHPATRDAAPESGEHHAPF